MFPEQVRGLAADARSDIFAVGAVLYEMLTGRRASQKTTSAETMSAILNEDPPPVSQVAPNLAPGLKRIVNRCLAKNPEQRIQHASDLAFALESLSDSTSASLPTRPKGTISPPTKWIWMAASAAVLVACRRDNVSGHARCLGSRVKYRYGNELVKRTLIGNDFTATGH